MLYIMQSLAKELESMSEYEDEERCGIWKLARLRGMARFECTAQNPGPEGRQER